MSDLRLSFSVAGIRPAIKLDTGTVGRRQQPHLVELIGDESPFGLGDVIEILGTIGPILRRLGFLLVATAFVAVAFQVVDELRCWYSSSGHASIYLLGRREFRDPSLASLRFHRDNMGFGYLEGA